MHWPATNGYGTAVDHWNRAVDAAEALVEQAGAARVLTVRAKDLFGGPIDGCHRCLSFLDLEPWEGTDQAWSNHRDSWVDFQATDLVLDDRQKDEVRSTTRDAADRMAASTVGWASPPERRHRRAADRT